MLKFVNQFWRFESQAQLDAFIEAAVASKDSYELERAGRARNGSFYAYGSFVKAPKAEPEVEATKPQEPEVPEIA